MSRLTTTISTILLAFALLGASGTASAENGFLKNNKFLQNNKFLSSDESYLTFNTFSLHFENFNDRNNVTPGIGWEYSPTGKLGFHVGTVKDSFNFQARYIGINYATQRYNVLGGQLRFIVGVTALHKQFSPSSEPETRIVPLPVIELKMSERFVLNVSGSPELDFQGQHTNGVLILQGKWNLF